MLCSFYVYIDNIYTIKFYYWGFWIRPFYFLSYKYGFCSKMMIGTILNLAFGNSLCLKSIQIIYISFTIFLLFIIALFLGKILKKAEERKSNWGIYFLVLLYLASPVKFSNYFAPRLIGRFDIYNFALTLLAIYLLFTKSSKTWTWILLSIICFLGMAIHHSFIFIFFPMILVLIIYEIYEKKLTKINLLGSISAFIITITSFLYFQFMSKSHLVVDKKILLEIIDNKVGKYYFRWPIEFEYFLDLKNQIIVNMLSYFPVLVPKMILTFFFLFPLILIFIIIWKNIYKQCYDKNAKSLLIKILSCNIFYIPPFLFANDWGRWLFFFITFQFITLFILWYKNFIPVVQVINQSGEYIKRNFFVATMLIMYLMCLNGTSELYLLRESRQFYNIFHLEYLQSIIICSINLTIRIVSTIIHSFLNII